MKPQLQPISAILILASLSHSLTSANLFESGSDSGLRGGRQNQKPGYNNQGQGIHEKQSRRNGLGWARQYLDHPSQEIDESQRQAQPEARIIGGSQASQNEYKFIASLSDHIGHFCGGSLITRDVVLTAAHCQGGPYNVAVGLRNLQSNQGQEIAMKRELPHPKYDDRTTDNDFMLVFLKSPAELNNDVSLVSLNADSSSPSLGSDVVAMGFGDTDIRDDVSKLSDVLMKVQVNVISNDDCDDSSGNIGGYSDNYHGQITQNMLCAKAKQKDSCQGDSGGPLVQGNTQVGVVSWGIGCASEHFPGVYARVSQAHEWIQSEVCKGSKYAEADGFDCSKTGTDASSNKPSNGSGAKPSSDNGAKPSSSNSGNKAVISSNGSGGDKNPFPWDDDWWPVGGSGSSSSGGVTSKASKAKPSESPGKEANNWFNIWDWDDDYWGRR